MVHKNKLSIVILGNNHADFAPYSPLIKILEKLAQRKIPCAFMEEGPSDETIKDAIDSTIRGIKQTQLIKRLAPELQNLYHTDKKYSRPYLTKSVYEIIKKSVQEKFMPYMGENQFNEGLLTQVILDVYRENAYIEQLELYKKMEQLQVPFTGIDAATSIYREQILASSDSEQSYYNNELTRINTMVGNVYTQSLRVLPEGGIVFVFTGNNHAHRLAANLFFHYRSSKVETKLDIDLHAFKLVSNYVKEWDEDRDYALELTASLDSTEIKEIYKSVPCPIIHNNEESDSFSFPELESLTRQLIQQHQRDRLRAPYQSLFSTLSPQNQLVNDVKEYIKENPKKVNDSFIKALETTKDYSLALRNVCAWGNSVLVKMLIKYSDVLPIDFHQTSTNGNTPLAWFEASKASSEEKREIGILLEEKMVVKETESYHC